MVNENLIVGRKKEINNFKNIVASPKSEFLAVYGRRRVGKTFLIREFFNYQFDFQIAGLANADTSQQLFNFHTALSRQSSLHFSHPPENWLIAFQRLIDHLEIPNIGKKKIVFFDELPWLDTKSSDFVMGLEHFWNSWASNRKDVVLVVCGSAASWMINVLINHSGGLHNRITHKMKVVPFTLKETEQMLSKKGGTFDRYQIVELYMAMGGIPYYIDMVKPELSVTQNIQDLFFEKDSFLRKEFFNLYRSIFKKHEIYELVVEILAAKLYGLQRSEIIEQSKISSGGTLTKVLADLEESGFITAYPSLDGKGKNIQYRLSDYYTAFYFKFIKDSLYVGPDVWGNLIDNPLHRTWQGFTFEQICIDHVQQIKKALSIKGVLTREAAWKGKTETASAQIDLLIDRRDHVINLCEAKFSLSEYTITKDYADKLRKKISVFKEVSQTKKAVFLTMLTTYGLEKNKYSNGLVQNDITMNELFE